MPHPVKRSTRYGPASDYELLVILWGKIDIINGVISDIADLCEWTGTAVPDLPSIVSGEAMSAIKKKSDAMIAKGAD